MARFDGPREKKSKSFKGSSSRSSSPKRGFKSNSFFEGKTRGRKEEHSDWKPPRSRSSRDFELTQVTCASCGDKCEVPFKPTSNKPVFCKDCFSKQDKPSSNKSFNKVSENDLDIINEKLNKIMKALKIK
ncbi:hypothetical protein GOV05_00270 [Candidatus Woesearchaeota archaeon]|nr:hypothetical protein [Candidatus Woesearchaeota archaeon]